MFNFFKKSEKESSKENLEDSSKIQECLLSGEELETIQKFELDWDKKNEDSHNMKIPCMMKYSEENMVEDLIETRCIRFYDKKVDVIKVKKRMTNEMLKIENSLINKFLFENTDLFIKGNMLSKFLNEDELNQKFNCSFFSDCEPLNLQKKCDFISIDKKIISIEKNIFFLDWESKEFSGWNTDYNGWEIERSFFNHRLYFRKYCNFNIFSFPSKTPNENGLDFNEIYDLFHSQTLMEFGLFEQKWVEDVTFMNCISSLVIFNFKEKLMKRTTEFYQYLEFEKKKNKELEIKEVEKIKKEVLFDLDKNNNKKLDVLESNGYNELLELMKKELQDKGDEYIHHLIKLKKFINDKGDNLNSIYNLLKSVDTKENLTFYKGVLNNEINIYQKLIFHSMSMITFLVEGDKFSFYEIYELFDELNVFDSKWEKDLSFKLSDINNSVEKTNNLLKEKFDELNTTIYNNSVETNKKLDKLIYTTQDSINSLTSTMNIRLKSINSSIDTNNLLTLINTYQTYKVNKNTKTLKN